jgi:signal transduction histidine kinase
MIGGMTGARVTASAPGRVVAPVRLLDRLRMPVVLLNLVGVLLVGAALVPTRMGEAPAIETVIAVVALAGWAVWALALSGRLRDVALLVGGLAAAVGAGLGAPSLIAPVIAAVLLAVSDPAHAPRPLAGFAVGLALALAGAAAVSGMALGDLLSLGAGLVLGVLGGVTRRQRRFADLQRDELVATSLAAEREAARAQLLEARSAAARDVHDVLAHSLGGLVLQLDAIEALLEHGRVEEASVRAGAARGLAADGLAEARRAVATLRDPDAAVPAAVPDDALEQLVAAHRALGAEARLVGDPSLRGVGPAHREALAAALRESLVNARRHAPGSTVDVRVAREPRAMLVHVTNPMPDAAVATDAGGHGLIGMRERFAALGDGSSVDAGPREDRFTVVARAVLA